MDIVTDYISSLLPPVFAKYISSLPQAKKNILKEIRLRMGKPLALEYGNGCTFAQAQGSVTQDDITAVMALLSDYSVNSVKDKLRRGFIPLKYGCRAGVAGEIIIKNGEIEFQRNINSINIRIARECTGCSDSVFSSIYNGSQIFSTLIISPPMTGKTTLLRDIARRLGDVANVCIIDERGEIASCYNGIPQFDVGKRTDILDLCSKPQGIPMAVRSMAPDVIITDEIGSTDDCRALADAAQCGVSFIATMHSNSIDSAQKRESTHKLFSDGIIKRAILLGNSKGVGTVEEIAVF